MDRPDYPLSIHKPPRIVLEGDLCHIAVEMLRADGVVRPVELPLKPREERLCAIDVGIPTHIRLVLPGPWEGAVKEALKKPPPSKKKAREK